MALGDKRRALAFHFSVRICYMFLKSKCRGESDLVLCMTSVLAKRMRLSSADFRFSNVFGRKIRRNSAVRTDILQVPKSCTDLDLTLLYILTLGKFVQKYKMLALGVCLSQPCPSAGRRFAASRSRLNQY